MMLAEASLVSPHERSLLDSPGASRDERSWVSIGFISFGLLPDAGCLRFVERRQDFGGVAFGLDLRPDPGDPAVGADEERRPGRSPVFLAVVLLLDP